ncbi:MAG: hypothetical protein ABIB71_03935 [Candidatus Woesearchaeota archaeon]
MVSITVALEESFKGRLHAFPWVNWSEVGSEESRKKAIFEEFIKTGTVSDEDQEFCDEMNWDPIDELQVKEAYVKKLKEIEKGPHSKMTLDELGKLLGLK